MEQVKDIRRGLDRVVTKNSRRYHAAVLIVGLSVCPAEGSAVLKRRSGSHSLAHHPTWTGFAPHQPQATPQDEDRGKLETSTTPPGIFIEFLPVDILFRTKRYGYSLMESYLTMSFCPSMIALQFAVSLLRVLSMHAR